MGFKLPGIGNLSILGKGAIKPFAFGPGAGLGSLLGQPSDPGKQQLAQVLALLGQAKTDTGIGYAKAQAEQRRALPLVNKAYADASANTLKLAENSKRAILANQPARLAGAQMGVDATGYNNSNIGHLASRGIYGDTSRALQQLDDLYAQHLNQIGVQQANDVAGLMSGQAGLIAQGANAGADITGQMASTIAGVQHVPKKTIWDILGVGAQALPYLAKGK